jgi:hypothetical protein
MKVTGTVKTIAQDELVFIHVIAPDGKVAQFVQTEVASDKSYSYDLKLKSDLAESSSYKIKVTYDVDEVAEARFTIAGKVNTGPAISVKTDKAAYSSGETIRISGKVSEDLLKPGQQVLIRVWNPEGAAYRFEPLSTSSDGSYSYEMKVGGELGLSGEYDVVASYGEDAEAKTTFNFQIPVGKTSYSLKFEDKSYPIPYEVTEGPAKVKSMILKEGDKSIVISLEGATESGQIIIELPREVIDSKADNGETDRPYLVMASDFDTGREEAAAIEEEDATADKRILVIDYEEGTDLIEIAGTQIVPEFGQIAILVFAATMIALVMLMGGGRFRIQGLGSLGRRR